MELVNKLTIIVYIGDLGSGKTLACLQQALVLYQYYQDIGIKDYKIYSNITFQFPKKWKIKFERFTSQREIDKIHKGAVVFDEMWSFADSRFSSSKKNKFFSQWSIKTRKRFLDLLITEQGENFLDKRIRIITNVIAYPEQRDLNLDLTRELGFNVYNFTVVSCFNPKMKMRKPMVYNFYNPPLFALYDTFEEPDKIKQESYLDYLEELEQRILKDKILGYIPTKTERISHLAEEYGLSIRKAKLYHKILFEIDEKEEILALIRKK